MNIKTSFLDLIRPHSVQSYGKLYYRFFVVLSAIPDTSTSNNSVIDFSRLFVASTVSCISCFGEPDERPSESRSDYLRIREAAFTQMSRVGGYAVPTARNSLELF